MADRTPTEILASIDASLKLLVQIAQRRSKASSSTAGGEIATAKEMGGKYGDPVLKFIPRDFSGSREFKGCNFSQCPPELLDMVAETFDYFASQAEEKNETTEKGKPVAEYKRLDARRARGWAKRIREGWKAPARPAAAESGHDGFDDAADPDF